MKVNVEHIPVGRLHPNEGQIAGLPTNPRQWTRADVVKIAASLKETPELFEARPVIAVPAEDGALCILGGNLRYQGALHNGAKDVPCVVIPADTPVQKMKEIVIKDNGSFGAWDYDELANNWDDNPLTGWGVPAWNVPGEGSGEVIDGLPPELAGLDLNPDKLPKIDGVGTDGLNRIIITYHDAEKEDIMRFLGVKKLDRIIFDFREIVK